MPSRLKKCELLKRIEICKLSLTDVGEQGSQGTNPATLRSLWRE